MTNTFGNIDPLLNTLQSDYGFEPEFLRTVCWSNTFFAVIDSGDLLDAPHIAWYLRGDRFDLPANERFEGLPTVHGLVPEEHLHSLGRVGLTHNASRQTDYITTSQ